MQLSDVLKRAYKLILFVAIFLILTAFLNAAFEPDEAETERMLTLYSQKSDISTVFVGNSAGEMLDADMYSSLTGEHSFNMCTPSQGLSVSLKNMKLAASDHKIDKIVLLLTFDTLNTEDYDGIDHLYDRVVNSASPLYVRIANYIKRNGAKSFAPDIVNREKSVNIWIPWEVETLHGIDNVKSNLRRRFNRLISGEHVGREIAYDLNIKNFDIKPGTLTASDQSLLEDDISKIPSLDISPDMIAADKVELLAKMCSFCRDNNIEFKVVVTPHRSDYYDRYESFRDCSIALSTYIDDFVSKRGFMYYNTEDDILVHDILPDEMFYDWEHISYEYMDKATDYLTDVILTKP